MCWWRRPHFFFKRHITAHPFAPNPTQSAHPYCELLCSHADSEVAQNDDIIMMREVAHKERTHARKMKAFFRYADHSKDHATWMQERYIEYYWIAENEVPQVLDELLRSTVSFNSLIWTPC